MAFERVKPEEVGVESGAVRALLREMQEEDLNLHGLILMRHGKVFAEGYVDPYRAELPHMLFSMTKPFMSAAIGLCVDDGLLTVEDRVVDFFPEKLSCRPCENMEKMKVKDLLTMSTGHTVHPEHVLGEDGDWVQQFLQSYVQKEPGSVFLYNTLGSYMLSAIVAKVTGKPCIEFLGERLFEPMGFAPYWTEVCPNGNSTGGYGLNICLTDLAKFCTLFLQDGVWEGKRLISKEWIAELSQFKSLSPRGGIDWESGYSYHFWLTQHEGMFRGDGAYGQHGIIMPKQDMVIAMNSCTFQVEKTLELFWKHLLPALHDEPLAPSDEADLLQNELDALAFEPVSGANDAPWAIDAEYELAENIPDIKKLGFTFGDEAKLHFVFGEHDCVLPMGYGCWKEGDTGVDKLKSNSFKSVFFEHCALSYAWKDERTLQLKFIWNTTPFWHDMTVQFDEYGCIVEWESPYATFETPCKKFKTFGRKIG